MDPKNLQVDWETAEKSLYEVKTLWKTDLPSKCEGNNKKIKVVSMEYIYQIKNLDREKRRFAKDTKLSKKYENVLEDKLKKWAQMLNINTEGL